MPNTINLHPGTIIIRYTTGEHFEYIGLGMAVSREDGRVVNLTSLNDHVSKFEVTARRIVRIPDLGTCEEIYSAS